MTTVFVRDCHQILAYTVYIRQQLTTQKPGLVVKPSLFCCQEKQSKHLQLVNTLFKVAAQCQVIILYSSLYVDYN